MDPSGPLSIDIGGAAIGAVLAAVIGAYVGYFFFCHNAVQGALIGALRGALVGGGLGELLDLRLAVKIIAFFLGPDKIELNLVTALGRIIGIGKIFGRQPFHINLPGGTRLTVPPHTY